MEKPFIVFKRASHSSPVDPYFVGKIVGETPKRVELSMGPARFIRPADVLVRYATIEEAEKLVQSIHGVRGEFMRRERAAMEAARASIAELILKAREAAK